MSKVVSWKYCAADQKLKTLIGLGKNFENAHSFLCCFNGIGAHDPNHKLMIQWFLLLLFRPSFMVSQGFHFRKSFLPIPDSSTVMTKECESQLSPKNWNCQKKSVFCDRIINYNFLFDIFNRNCPFTWSRANLGELG